MWGVFWNPVFTFVLLWYLSLVGKMVRKRYIGDVGDVTFGDETWLRVQDDAMSVGTARFALEVFVRLWVVMMRPKRSDPFRYRRMYLSLYD